jgi:hypothetical protein
VTLTTPAGLRVLALGRKLTGTTNPATVAMTRMDRDRVFTETDTPIIRLSPTSLFFSATRGEPGLAQTVSVENADGGRWRIGPGFPDVAGWADGDISGCIAR